VSLTSSERDPLGPHSEMRVPRRWTQARRRNGPQWPNAHVYAHVYLCLGAFTYTNVLGARSATRWWYRGLKVELSITPENYEAAANVRPTLGPSFPPASASKAFFVIRAFLPALFSVPVPRKGVKGESASGQPDCVFISDY